MKSILRLLGVIFVIYVTVFSMKFLQQSFDEGDLRRAREAFNRLKIQEQTVWQAMAKDMQIDEKSVHCDELLVSRYSGPIRFECFAKTKDKKFYVWEVDVAGFRVTPSNTNAMNLVEEKL